MIVLSECTCSVGTKWSIIRLCTHLLLTILFCLLKWLIKKPHESTLVYYQSWEVSRFTSVCMYVTEEVTEVASWKLKGSISL